MEPHFVTKQEINILNKTQINEIHEILSTPTKYKHIDQHIHKMKEDQSIEITMLFQSENTFLHSFCTDMVREKIMYYIFHRISWIVCIVLFFISQTLKFTNRELYCIFSLFCTVFFWIPWFTIMNLASNRNSIKKILATFEFWIKMCYTTVWVLSESIYDVYLSKEHQLNYLVIPQTITRSLAYLLCIAFVCTWDANIFVQHHKWLASSITTLLAVSLLSLSIYYELSLFYDKEVDDSLFKITSKINISLRSNMAHSMRILSIFLFKQCYLMYKGQRNKVNKALSIRITPFIEWTDMTNTKSTAMSETASNVSDFQQTIEQIEEINIETANIKQSKRPSFSIDSVHLSNSLQISVSN